MFFDGIRIAEGAELNNLVVPVGDELPPSPAEGELFYATGLGAPTEGVYLFNGTAWAFVTFSYTPVNISGDTMTGPLTLPADPTNPLDAATKQYVDNFSPSAASIGGPGTIADALISQSSVTQHQAALTIAESQITDGSILARVGGSETITGAWSFSNPVTVGTPTAGGHAATKTYVDNLTQGISTKAAVLCASTVNLSAAYYNGINDDGIGATLTATSNGVLTLDTISPAATQHVLIKNQTTKLQNGAYVVTDPGSVGTPWVLTRRSTENQSTEIPGAYLFVQDGSQEGSGWVMVVANPVTFAIGYDDITVNQFSGATPLAGGLSTYIQYNEGGYLTGDADFTWSSITNSLLFGPAAFIRGNFDTATRANRLSIQSSPGLGYTKTYMQVLAPAAYATGNVAGVEYIASTDPSIASAVTGVDITVSGVGDARAHFKAMPINSGTAPTLNLVVGAGASDYALTAYPTTHNVRIGSGAFAADPGYALQVDGETSFNGDARFTGTARRFHGDFTQAGAIADRHFFQSSTTNARTAVGAIPNGTSVEGGFVGFASSNPTNSTAYIAMLTNTSEVRIESGSSNPVPIIISIGTSTTERARFDVDGNFIVGTTALLTTATNGFVYTSAMPGGPSGVPTSYTGRVPMVFDSTNYKLFAYMGAQWREIGAAPIGSGFTFQATPPGSANPGDRWIDSDSATEYTYVNDGNSSQWIETGGGSSVATIPQNEQTADYTLTLNDAGKHIFHPSSDVTARVFTIPANSSVEYPIGTAITFVNQNAAGSITIAINTDTMRLAGSGTTGSRTLAANGVATAIKITATEWIISGTGLT